LSDNNSNPKRTYFCEFSPVTNILFLFFSLKSAFPSFLVISLQTLLQFQKFILPLPHNRQSLPIVSNFPAATFPRSTSLQHFSFFFPKFPEIPDSSNAFRQNLQLMFTIESKTQIVNAIFTIFSCAIQNGGWILSHWIW
jgi:hypothetical protein